MKDINDNQNDRNYSYIHNGSKAETAYIPAVFFNTPRGDQRSTDVISYMLRQGVIWIGSINSTTATIIDACVMYMRLELLFSEFKAFINSFGGCVYSMFLIINAFLSSGMISNTITNGIAASAGSAIASCGHKRYCVSTGTFMLHQPRAGFDTTRAVDVENIANAMKRTNETMAGLYSDFSTTGTTKEEFLTIMQNDTYLAPKEVQKLGLIDEIIELPEVKRKKKK